MSRKMKVTVTGAALLVIAVLLVVVLGFSPSRPASDPARFGAASVKAAEPMGDMGTGKAAQAIEKAGNAEKYAFVLFYRDANGQLDTARTMVQNARKRISRKSEAIEVNVNDPADQDMVAKCGANRIMLPLVLVIAPNGATMGGLPARTLNEDRLVDFVGSRASEQCLKALQQKNMVALCILNSRTADNAGAMRSIEDLLSDPKYGSTTAVVTADPSDQDEAKFITKLGLDPKTPIATTALLAPPGSVVYTFQGGVTKGKLLADVKVATAPKSGGCCPAGSGKSCGPTGGVVTPPSPTTRQPQVQVKKVPSPTTATTSATPPTTTQSR